MTAQRRAESAQSVPISLQAFSADGLRQAGIKSTDDLASAVAGLLIQQVRPRPNFYVRSVGNNSGSATPSVLTFIDGVYIPFSLSSGLVNIETLEVRNGPQGMTCEVRPGTNLTLGGRFTYEKRGIEGFVMCNGAELPGTRGKLSQTFKEPTWRVALDHKFGPDFMAYASVSRGFNAGFYNVSNNAGYASEAKNPPVKPEFLTAY